METVYLKEKRKLSKYMVEIIVNADDFGISKGVNYAVFKGGMFGILNSASLMVNQNIQKMQFG